MKYCTEEIIKKIGNYLDDHKKEITDDLMHLMRVPSVRSEAKPGKPFGEECAKMLDVTKDLFEKNGFESKIADGYEYEVSYCGKKGGKQIGILAHTDVVPVVENDWTLCRPFEPKIIDGYVVGRGCIDDKSGVIEALYTAKLIRDLGLELNNEIVMINGAAEETGMEDIAAFTANERIPEASIAPDADFPCYSGEKNMMHFELVSASGFEQITEFDGGIAFNVILEKIIVKIKYSEELFREIKNKCALSDVYSVSSDENTIEFTAKGVTRHGAYPEGSVNAALLAAEVLAECENLCVNDRRIMSDIKRYLTKYYGEGFGIEYSDDIFGKLTCSNGLVRMTENNAPAVMFDIRAGVDCDMNGVLKKIKNLIGDRWIISDLEITDGYNIPDDNPVRLAIEETYGAVTGITGLKGEKCSGGTYSRALKNSVSIGSSANHKAKPFAYELPAGHGEAHQPDEHLSVDAFLEAIKIVACYVLEIDKII